jgi:hypothetical protein
VPEALAKRILRTQALLEALADGLEELGGGQALRGDAFHEVHQVLGGEAFVQGVEAGTLELVGIVHELGEIVHLTALAEGAAPGEDRRNRVRGGLFTLQVLVVVTGHGAVGRLVLVLAVRGNQDGGHHGQGTEGGGHHVGHHVTVIVLAGPDEAALGTHHARHGVVDQGVEVLDAGGLELLLVLLEHLVEDGLEAAVVFLGDGVLGGEPDGLLQGQGILEAGMGEAADGLVQVVLAEQDAGALELMDHHFLVLAVDAVEDKLRGTGLIDLDLHIAVDVAIGVTGDGDGLLPELHGRVDARDGDRRTEHGAVHHGADGAVRALPHLVEVVLGHALGVRGDGRALDGDAEALRRIGGIHSHLIVGLVAVGQAQVIVFGLQVHEREDEFVLDHLPQDPGHFVAVHFDERGEHFNLFHGVICGFCSSS